MAQAKSKFKFSLSPAKVIMLSFLGLSILGAILLAIPAANSNGEWRDWVSAFFMSTTSVCVTGLVVADVGKDFTLFGQVVILFLMQVGGLSYMTFTTILLYMTGKKLSFSDSKIFDLSNNSDKKIDFSDFVFKIALLTVIIEFIGFLCLLPDSFKTCTYNGNVKEFMFQALFHAVSAFCNAGISLYSNSLEGFRDNYWVLFMFSILPILGGLGYTVLTSFWNHFSGGYGRIGHRRVTLWTKIKDFVVFRNFSMHTKVSIAVTGILLVLGIGIQLALIYMQDLPALNDAGFWDKLWVSIFQSVSSRSSGFNSIPLLELGDPSLIFLIVWMIIGACPGGTGGGIKVTTLAVVAMIMYSALRADKDVTITNRTVRDFDRKRAVIVLVSTLGMIFFFTWLVSIAESGKGMAFVEQLFEVTSGFTTVGLSTGITPDLTDFSKIIICICMLIGRPGPLLFLMALVTERKRPKGGYAEEGILIG